MRKAISKCLLEAKKIIFEQEKVKLFFLQMTKKSLLVEEVSTKLEQVQSAQSNRSVESLIFKCWTLQNQLF